MFSFYVKFRSFQLPRNIIIQSCGAVVCVRVFLYWLIHSLIKFSLLGFGPNRVSACVVLCYPQFLHWAELHTWAYGGDNCCSCTSGCSGSLQLPLRLTLTLQSFFVCLSLWIFSPYCLVICRWERCTEFSSIFPIVFVTVLWRPQDM